MLKIRSAAVSDAHCLANRLRESDIKEIKAASTDEPLIVLKQGIVWSEPVFTITNEQGKPLAIFGIVPDTLQKDTGRVWMLGSDELARYSITFLRLSRQWVKKLHHHYPVLWNVIDARNEVHLRWLRWCGFKILRKIDHYGPEQRPFYEFEKVRDNSPRTYRHH